MTWMNVKTIVVLAIVCALSTISRAMGAAHIEIQSQTGTALTMKFFDSNDALYTLSFTRPTSNDVWSPTTSESRGIVFGNGNPQYAGPARRRALGITPAQALQTFSTAIVNRPLDDLTIYKTHSGMAIGLWQEGWITEVWYVGTLVQDWLQAADEGEHDAACDAALATCCDTQDHDGDPDTPPHPEGNPDSCESVAGNCPDHKEQACDCLDAMCHLCVHPQPDPPAVDLCTPAERAMSNEACDTYLDAECGPSPPPPPPPQWLQDIRDLLEHLLNLFQEYLESLPQV